uniref:EGF-like domain-containing protein n=1 Tax=Meloidogyne hapla TaxID=6305 RepID=A0A1I8C2S0_MELHA
MFIILLPTRQRLSSFYLFFIILFIYFNLIIGSGQLKFQLTTFNSSEQFRVELCANEFRWRESSKSEWGKDCKFGRAEVFLSGNGTFDERQQTLISTSTTSISLPFSHFWRQSFTLELRLWHNNVLLNENNNKSICYCINDGKCVDNKCVCPVGYWGNNCEKCIPNSRCKGFCRQRPGECSCPEGKGGQFCEKDLIFCSKNSPCQNGGICQNNAEGNYTCKCKPGYGGINCERQLNNCEEEPCYNGAKCINLFSSPGFRCECPPSLGLYGRFCEIKAPNGCKDLPCQNGGSCADFNLKNNSNTSFKCLCPDGWTGHFCEQPWGRCTENPCQNGGSCITDNFNINGYVCLCPIGWSGINCENK